jgi:2-hydroxy-3-oxopropionate reductase
MEPVFAAMGRATHVGPNGCGQLSKLANQVIVAITIGAVSEALILAGGGGADRAQVREALQGGFASSRILSEHGQRMVQRHFEPGGPAKFQVKDLKNALAAAERLGLDLPITRLVNELFTAMVASGKGDMDHSGLLTHLEAINGLEEEKDA